MLTHSRLAGFGNDYKLMNAVTRYLVDRFELTVYVEEKSVYKVTPVQALIVGHGILAVDTLVQVFNGVLEQVKYNPMWLLNQPYEGGRTQFLTAVMLLCGEEPDLDDAFMKWLCERILSTMEGAPEFLLTYERETPTGWKLVQRRMNAKFLNEEFGPMLLRRGEGQIANIRVQDRAGEDVTFSFACFCG